MGNEASLEAGEGGLGAGQQQQPPASPGPAGSAPSRGQLPGPSSAGASPAGGRHADPSTPGRLENSGRLAGQSSTPQTFRQPVSSTESTKEPKSHAPSTLQKSDGPRRTLQVDNKGQRTGRSPLASPDRGGTTPTSPYSVPQIAPLPSSTACPICNTTDLTSSPNQPNFNTCTQCRNEVCNQCGFNPNPHLTEVKEWLCLNCQMQRALGMDMTTAPRSKSQQQLHSPSLSPSHSPAKQANTQAPAQSFPKLSQSQPQLSQLQQSPRAQPKPQEHTQPQHQQHMQSKPQQPSQSKPQQPSQSKPQQPSQSKPQQPSQSKPQQPSQSKPQQHPQPQHQQHLQQQQPLHQKPLMEPQTQQHPQAQPHHHQHSQPHTQHQQKTQYQPQQQQQHKSQTQVKATSQGQNQAHQKPHMQHHPQTHGKTGMETSLGQLQMENGSGTNIIPTQQGKTVQQREQINQGYTKPSAPQDVVRSSPQHSQTKPSPGEQRKTLGSSPAKTPASSVHGIQDQAQEGLTGKLFGFGASLLNQASTLISVPAETAPQSQSSPGKVSPKIIFSDASKEAGTKPQDATSTVPGRVESSPVHKHGKIEPVKPKEVPKVLCPLCKTELKVDSSDPSNYNTCTSCKKQVCNMCGFNPTPHLVEERSTFSPGFKSRQLFIDFFTPPIWN